MFGMQLAVKLPLVLNAPSLQLDLGKAKEFQFATHPLNYHDGSWKAINLIYSGGQTEYRHQGAHGFGTAEPEPTAVLKQCAAFRHVLDRLPGKVVMARLSALPAGGRIHEHYDATESVDFGHWRIHIPIVTDPRVRFHLGYRRRHWGAGEAWVGDFTFPHSIHNRSPVERVHMIVDIVPAQEMISWLPEGHLSAQALARRAKLRKLHKQVCWYKYRLAGVDRHGRRDVPKTSAVN